MEVFKAIVGLSAATFCCFVNIFPARANPQMGQLIIRDQYSMLMQACNGARVLNGNGMSNFSNLARNSQIGSYISAGYSAEEAQRMVNGMAWAIKKECPDVW